MHSEENAPRLSNRATLWILLALVAAHITLAMFHASVAPWRTGGVVAINPSIEKDIGAPDERQHANYVSGLAHGAGFPVFDPKDPNLYENYQSHQPPAFYVLARVWGMVTGVDFGEKADTVGDGPITEKSNGFRLRLLNVFIGASTVTGVFFLGLWGFGRRDLALAAAAFAALLPMFVALSGAVSNDPMLIALCTWVLALCARGISSGWTWKLVALVGVLTGIAFLTKTTAIALLPALLVGALVPQRNRPSFAMAAALLAIAVGIAAPWWVRNQQLYGDPLAMKAFTDAFQGSAQKETIVGIIQTQGDASPELTYWKDWVGWWTARSFFGVFGYMDIWMNESGRPISSSDKNTLYRLLLVGMLLAFFAWAYASAKQPVKERWPIQAVNAVFLVVIVVLFLRFNMQYFQAQARYLLPAIGPIACGVGIAATFLAKRRGELGIAVVALILLAVNVYAIGILPIEFQKRIDAARSQAQ